MIIIDEPIMWGALNKRLGPSSHMMSTLHGIDGTNELCAFAAIIGMRREWIQDEGTYKEHFDVFGKRFAIALKAGAKLVNRRGLVTVMRDKRSSVRKDGI